MMKRSAPYVGLLIGAAILCRPTFSAEPAWRWHDPSSRISRPAPNPGRYSETAWWAVPSDTGKFSGGYIGGGAAWFGEPRALHEGTWGWDYDGVVLQKRIWLNWLHGRRYQDGGGSYEPDGPKFFQFGK